MPTFTNRADYERWKAQQTHAVRSVRFVAGDLARPVELTLVLTHAQAERLCQDLQCRLGETAGRGELEARWVGTVREGRG